MNIDFQENVVARNPSSVNPAEQHVHTNYYFLLITIIFRGEGNVFSESVF